MKGAIVSELAKKQCTPCKGGVPPLNEDQIARLLKQVPGWAIENGHLCKIHTFPDFAQALAFVNRVGALAEEQGHHPDIYLAWGKVKLELWTHKINGLTERDFIFAAKASELF